MGGMVAQLVYRRHPGLLSGLVLCATARSVQESSMDDLVVLGLPVLAAAMQWNPWSKALSAEAVSAMVLGRITMRAIGPGFVGSFNGPTSGPSCPPSGPSARSARMAGSVRLTSRRQSWSRPRIRSCPPSRQRDLAATVPGAVVVELDADHGVCVTAPERFAGLLLDACRLIDPGTAGVVDLAGAARASMEDGRPLSER